MPSLRFLLPLAVLCLLQFASCKKLRCYNGHCDELAEYCDTGEERCLSCRDLCHNSKSSSKRYEGSASLCEKLCPYYIDRIRKNRTRRLTQQIERLNQTLAECKKVISNETVPREYETKLQGSERSLFIWKILAWVMMAVSVALAVVVSLLVYFLYWKPRNVHTKVAENRDAGKEKGRYCPVPGRSVDEDLANENMSKEKCYQKPNSEPLGSISRKSRPQRTGDNNSVSVNITPDSNSIPTVNLNAPTSASAHTVATVHSTAATTATTTPAVAAAPAMASTTNATSFVIATTDPVVNTATTSTDIATSTASGVPTVNIRSSNLAIQGNSNSLNASSSIDSLLSHDRGASVHQPVDNSFADSGVSYSTNFSGMIQNPSDGPLFDGALRDQQPRDVHPLVENVDIAHAQASANTCSVPTSTLADMYQQAGPSHLPMDLPVVLGQEGLSTGPASSSVRPAALFGSTGNQSSQGTNSGSTSYTDLMMESDNN